MRLRQEGRSVELALSPQTEEAAGSLPTAKGLPRPLLSPMIRRARQFLRAVRARLGEGDRQYVASHLSPAEQGLFYAMHRADQSHALHVARTAERLAGQGFPKRELLVRAALLHDVGRRKGDLDIWGKVFAVLMDRCLPGAARRMAQDGRGRLSHAMAVYYGHPELGAKKLRALGLEEEAMLSARHHLPPGEGDPPELDLLRLADEMN